MGFIGPYYAGPSPMAAGVNAFSDNFSRMYQQGRDNSRADAQTKMMEEYRRAQMDEARAQAAERQQRIAELQRKAQEEIAMRKELAGLFTPQSAPDMAFAPGAIEGGGGSGQPAVLTPEGQGMMTGRPGLEQFLGVLGKYKPEAALTAGVSLRNTDERLQSQEAIQRERMKAQAEALTAKLESAIEVLKTKNDAASKLLETKLEGVLEQIKVRADVKPQNTQKPPAGYRFTADGGLEPIPGGPADAKKQKAFTDAANIYDNMTFEMDRLAKEAKAIQSHPGLGRITGIMGAIPNVPGSNAANVEARLNTLKSQTAFSVLQAMRNSSKTGGALGQVSDKEGQLLQENLATLDKAQSEEEFKNALQRIIDFTDASKDKLKRAYERQVGGEGQPAPTKTPTTPRFRIIK